MCNLQITQGGRTENSCLSEELTHFSMTGWSGSDADKWVQLSFVVLCYVDPLTPSCNVQIEPCASFLLKIFKVTHEVDLVQL